MRRMAAFACAVMLICLGALPSYAEKRVALVIGNSAYQNTPALPNPKNDATDMAAALQPPWLRGGHGDRSRQARHG
jgi:hypothetical protein